jgi:hypothetical protein
VTKGFASPPHIVEAVMVTVSVHFGEGDPKVVETFATLEEAEKFADKYGYDEYPDVRIVVGDNFIPYIPRCPRVGKVSRDWVEARLQWLGLGSYSHTL